MRKSIGVVLALSLGLSACGQGDGGTNPSGTPVHVYLTVDSTSITLPTGGVAMVAVAANPTLASSTVSLSTFYWTADCVIAWVGYACGDGATHLSSSPNPVTCLSKGKTTVSIGLQESDLESYVLDSAQVVGITCDSTRAEPRVVRVDGAPVQLTATDATTGRAVSNPNLVWSSDNRSVVSVVANGTAVPDSPGRSVVTLSQTLNNAKATVAQALVYVTGNGSCSLDLNGAVLRTLTFRVLSDPGNHAAQIGLPETGALTFAFGTSAGTNMQVAVSGSGPTAAFGNLGGGWMAPTDCNFIVNGTGPVAGLQSVGARLQGTWTGGALNLTYTVGTSGELSGGPTIYAVSG
jgi:hypothetical protein